MRVSTMPAIVFPLVLLGMLALITFWINKTVQTPLPKLDGSSRHDADYIVSNFVTTQTDVNGLLRFKLAAVEMKHFPDDDTTALQRPRYTQFSVGKPYTRIEGLHGYMSGDGEQVKLVDQVKVTRQAFAEKGEMTVDTNYLEIYPNQELARTESPVIIRQAPKTIIYATGMLYEKRNRTVTLLHKVRAHYERPQLGASVVKSHKPAAKNIKSMTKHSTATPVTPSLPNNNARIRRRYE